MVPAVLSAWIPCLLFAALIVIGIPLLCLLAGDEPAHNEIAHESADGRERDPEPPLLAHRVSASRWHYQPQ